MNFPRRKSRDMIELNITSLLDMMSTILFFLLLSVTFMDMTSLTLPPATKSSVNNPFASVPLSPKVYAYSTSETSIRVLIKWEGKSPGELVQDIERTQSDQINEDVIVTVTKMINGFYDKYPKESSIQMSLSADINYQEMISIMDAVRGKIANIILLDYKESHNMARARAAKGEG